MSKPLEGIVIIRTGGEIGIKSKPVRAIFEDILLKNVRRALRDAEIPCSRIWRIAGRIYVVTEETERASKAAARIFGISSTSPGLLTNSGLESVVRAGKALAKTFVPGTFAVQSRRTGNHPYTSQQLSSELGKALLDQGQGLKVDLDDPQQTLSVEVREDMAILFSKTIRGPDGFPWGTQDGVIGIIDESYGSVIASWCMMKRGCSLRALIFSGHEGPSEAVMDNLRRLASWIPEGVLKVTSISAFSDNLSPPSSPSSLVAPPVTSPPSPPCLPGIIQIRLATRLAERKGMGGVVSSIHPGKLDLIGMAMESPASVSVFLPLVAIDDGLLKSWMKFVGVEGQAGLSGGENDAFGQTFSISEVEIDLMLSGGTELRVKAEQPHA